MINEVLIRKKTKADDGCIIVIDTGYIQGERYCNIRLRHSGGQYKGKSKELMSFTEDGITFNETVATEYGLKTIRQ